MDNRRKVMENVFEITLNAIEMLDNKMLSMVEGLNDLKDDIIYLAELFEQEYSDVDFNDYHIDYQDAIDMFSRLELLKRHGEKVYENIGIEQHTVDGVTMVEFFATPVGTNVTVCVGRIVGNEKQLTARFEHDNAKKDYELYEKFWEMFGVLIKDKRPKETSWAW